MVGFAVVIVLGSVLGALAGTALHDPSIEPVGRCRPFAQILSHNAAVLAVVFVLAIVSVGSLAALYLLVSFWVVGFQIGQAVAARGWRFTADGLVWHLPFEVLAFVVVPAGATASGLSLWARVVQRPGRDHPPWRRVGLTVLGSVVAGTALLLVAATIEAHLSRQC